MAAEVLRRAVRSLAETRLRTFLTLAGIAIGIAALFSLLSIAQGIRERIVNKWLSSGLMTSLSVLPQETLSQLRHQYGERGSLRRAKTGLAEERRPLDDASIATISKIEGVRRAWPVISRFVMLEPERAEARHQDPARSSESSGDATRSSRTLSQPQRSQPPEDGSSRAHASGTAAGAPSGTDSGLSRPRTEAPSSPIGASGETSPPAGRSETREGGESGSETTTYATLRGFDTDFFWGEDYLHITAGRPLTDPKAHDLLLSEDRLKDLGFKDAKTAVGGIVIVRWRELAPAGAAGAETVPGLPFAVAPKEARYRIAGVFEKRGALSLRNTGVIVPTEQALAIPDPERLRSLFEGGATKGYPGLDVYLTPGADLEAIESRIKGMGFGTISGAEIVAQIRRSILVLQSVLGGLGTIAIAVASLGIANTLLTAVYERMREIGVMKAVGARRRDIRRQFFAEAGMIGFIGGLAGLILGFCADHLLAFVIGHIVRRQGGEDPGAIAVHTPFIALACLVFSIVLSLLAGTFPAARAARLDPVQTLRHE